MCGVTEPRNPEKGIIRTGVDKGPVDDSAPGMWRCRWNRVHTWKGLRTVLIVIETVAALKHEEALVLMTRALMAVGDMIVGLNKHERS